MRKKAKGFTLLEVIITLAITVVILGAIYTVFFTSNRTIATTEINSNLQQEAELIQNELLQIGEEASGLAEISSSDVDVNKEYSEINNFLKNGITAEQIKFVNLSDVNVIKYIDKKLIINGQVVSSNVEKFKIKPLDLFMAKEEDAKIIDTNGLEISIILKTKSGYSEVEYPLSLIVKFRNK